MNNSQILKQAYESFLLSLGGKKVPAPYRINIPFQPDRTKYGKSDPETLLKDTIQIAQQLNFDLRKATTEEIRSFMEENLLGLDCSGFAYHMLDYLLKKIGLGGIEKVGFPKASSTNVSLLTSAEFSIGIQDFKDTRAGDLIRLNSEQEISHVLIILENKDGIITYAHSSTLTKIKGVHQDQIKNSQFPEELGVFSYNINAGDGIRRLKALQ